MKATVRPRERRDLDALAEVLVRVHAVDGYPVEGVADPHSWLHPARELGSWTAELGGKPVGHISLVAADASDDAAAVWHSTTHGDLDRIAIPVRLFVDPDHRGHGAASRLMSAASAYATHQGRVLVFDVMEKDKIAIRLYEMMGCTRIGTIQHDAGDGTTHAAAVYLAPAGPRLAQPGQPVPLVPETRDRMDGDDQ
jgi:GNAT superfamily N-acetyltransferase